MFLRSSSLQIRYKSSREVNAHPHLRLHAFRRCLGPTGFATAMTSKSESQMPNRQRLWAFLGFIDYTHKLEPNNA
ncbi:hypothetical protein L596_009856 [Steinernema carpocapsae]|uniref:Uncharacterized protein n=1 Tax=Steinernema carpocapsae TaxID=34508 RepID=A0A4U5PGS9_STECR|nr:hypothetical protein L596_009856 [Steinernema carpocapsae]